jgi:hypothetical protein
MLARREFFIDASATPTLPLGRGIVVMARLDPIEKEDAPDEARIYYEADELRYGVVLNNTKLYAHNVAILKAVKQFAIAFGKADTLPLALKSMLRVRVAILNQCPF